MSYFLLPQINHIIETNTIKLIYGENKIIISKSLA